MDDACPLIELVATRLSREQSGAPIGHPRSLLPRSLDPTIERAWLSPAGLAYVFNGDMLTTLTLDDAVRIRNWYARGKPITLYAHGSVELSRDLTHGRLVSENATTAYVEDCTCPRGALSGDVAEVAAAGDEDTACAACHRNAGRFAFCTECAEELRPRNRRRLWGHTAAFLTVLAAGALETALQMPWGYPGVTALLGVSGLGSAVRVSRHWQRILPPPAER
jgi:hypothetical protein